MFIFQRIVLSVLLFFHLVSSASQGQLIRPVIRITDSRDLVEKEITNRWNKTQKIAKDSRCLKELLIQRKVIEVEHFLEDENIVINPFWSGYSMQSAQGSKLTIIDLACQIGSIYTIERIFQRAQRDCFIDIVESLSQQNSGNVLRCFLNNHKERAEGEKFYIWRTAIEKESLWNKIPQISSEPRAIMWDKIITLLFLDDLNEVDKNGDTLLHIAVYCRNIEAIKYLLSKDANTHIMNKKRCTPIYYVGNDLAMRFLLEKNDV